MSAEGDLVRGVGWLIGIWFPDTGRRIDQYAEQVDKEADKVEAITKLMFAQNADDQAIIDFVSKEKKERWAKGMPKLTFSQWKKATPMQRADFQAKEREWILNYNKPPPPIPVSLWVKMKPEWRQYTIELTKEWIRRHPAGINIPTSTPPVVIHVPSSLDAVVILPTEKGTETVVGKAEGVHVLDTWPTVYYSMGYVRGMVALLSGGKVVAQRSWGV